MGASKKVRSWLALGFGSQGLAGRIKACGEHRQPIRHARPKTADQQGRVQRQQTSLARRTRTGESRVLLQQGLPGCVTLQCAIGHHHDLRVKRLALDQLAGEEMDAALIKRVGLGGAFSEPVMGEVKAGGALPIKGQLNQRRQSGLLVLGQSPRRLGL